MATVIFHGACGCVTGSCTELAWSGRKLLVDWQSGKFCLLNSGVAPAMPLSEDTVPW